MGETRAEEKSFCAKGLNGDSSFCRIVEKNKVINDRWPYTAHSILKTSEMPWCWHAAEIDE